MEAGTGHHPRRAFWLVVGEIGVPSIRRTSENQREAFGVNRGSDERRRLYGSGTGVGAAALVL
jgi:hypothetical protein